jgi:hypothetical protein
VPRHLYFFTEPCVRSYLARTGFDFVATDYSDRILALQSSHWLAYRIARLRGREFTWREGGLSRSRFFAEHKLAPGLVSSIRYAMASPLTVLGGMLLPLRNRIQMLRKRYGIVTYVARKH